MPQGLRDCNADFRLAIGQRGKQRDECSFVLQFAQSLSGGHGPDFRVLVFQRLRDRRLNTDEPPCAIISSTVAESYIRSLFDLRRCNFHQIIQSMVAKLIDTIMRHNSPKPPRNGVTAGYPIAASKGH